MHESFFGPAIVLVNMSVSFYGSKILGIFPPKKSHLKFEQYMQYMKFSSSNHCTFNSFITCFLLPYFRNLGMK